MSQYRRRLARTGLQVCGCDESFQLPLYLAYSHHWAGVNLDVLSGERQTERCFTGQCWGEVCAIWDSVRVWWAGGVRGWAKDVNWLNRFALSRLPDVCLSFPFIPMICLIATHTSTHTCPQHLSEFGVHFVLIDYMYTVHMRGKWVLFWTLQSATFNTSQSCPLHLSSLFLLNC